MVQWVYMLHLELELLKKPTSNQISLKTTCNYTLKRKFFHQIACTCAILILSQTPPKIGRRGLLYTYWCRELRHNLDHSSSIFKPLVNNGANSRVYLNCQSKIKSKQSTRYTVKYNGPTSGIRVWSLKAILLPKQLN